MVQAAAEMAVRAPRRGHDGAGKLTLVPKHDMRPDGPLPSRVQGRRDEFFSRNRSRGMRLGYFTMPVHPMHRDWAETLKEDREAIILADQLGFHDAFMGEHLTDRCENVTNSMVFQASLISETKRIKLATGTTKTRCSPRRST
jgi:hypothetical protein